MSKIVTYVCPKCGASIEHDLEPADGKVNDHEQCTYCQRWFSIEELENYERGGATAQGTNVTSAPTAMYSSYIDDSESALAFLDNYFETYDWNKFYYNSELSIREIDQIVEKQLVKAAANPATWELHFNAKATPLLRKIKGLKTLAQKYIDEFLKSEDTTNAYRYFDSYKRISSCIISQKDDICKKLSAAIKYHKRYNGDQSVSAALESQLQQLTVELNNIHTVNNEKDIPGYLEACQQKTRRKADELRAKGIDAEVVYSKSISAYKSHAPAREVLASFLKVDGYKDAQDYCDKLNAQFAFPIEGAIYIRLANASFYMTREVPEAFNVNEAGKEAEKTEQEQQDTANKKQTYSLYPVVDKIPAISKTKKPIVSGITDILKSFAGTIFYVKNNSTICYIDTTVEPITENIIEAGKTGDYDNAKGEVESQFGGKYMFIKKKLQAVSVLKKGCFKKLFSKNKADDIVVNTYNNYSLVAIDLEECTAETIVPELVDIKDIFGDQIFYRTADKETESQSLYAYNYETKENKSILVNADIQAVVDGKVIYTLWEPVEWNNALYALDLHSGDAKLLDTNVYGYYATIDGDIYYYVGNSYCLTLYSISADGSNKREILNDIASVKYLSGAETRYGWLYLTTGNTAKQRSLYKISKDGINSRDKGFVTLCNGYFKKLIEIEDGYVYYLNAFDELHSVREDGKDDKCLLTNVGQIVKKDTNDIYLLRKERVSSSKTSNSLYKVSIDGHNLTKLAFDVSTAIENKYNNDEIYLYKTTLETYKVKVPVDKKNFKTSYPTVLIKTLLIYNTKNGTFEEVLSLGRPEADGLTYKKGCFKKKEVKIDSEVEKVPNKIKYIIKDGEMGVGEMGLQQAAAAEAKQAEEAEAKANKGGCAPKKK